MASQNIKGINIEIGGDTLKLENALKGLDDTVIGLSKEIGAINKELKFDSGNTVLLNQKMDVLKQSITATAEKLRTLETAQKQATSGFDALGNALTPEQIRALDLEVEKTRNSLKSLGSQLDNTEKTLSSVDDVTEDTEKAVKELGNEFDQSGQKSSGFADMLKANLTSQAIIGAVKSITSAIREIGMEIVNVAAEVRAQEAQFEQTFGEMGSQAEAAINRVASASGILDTRMNATASSIYAFARSSGADTDEAMTLMEKSLQVAADGAAYYDKSLEETSATLQSFLKGNFANDAALGVSATEFTRNAKAVDMFGKKYNELSEIQKQQALLQMVIDAQELSGAMGQAAREADGWENVTGNFNEVLKRLKATIGEPVLDFVTPIVQDMTAALQNAGPTVELVAGAIRSLLSGEGLGEDAKIAVASMVKEIPQLFLNMTENIGDMFSNGGGTLGSAVSGFVSHAINGLKMGIDNSPVLLEGGKNIVSGIISGVKNAMPGLGEAGKSIIGAVKTAIGNTLDSLGTEGPKIITQVLNGVKGALPSVLEGGTEIVRSIVTGIGKAAIWLFESAREALNSFLSGISENMPSISTAAINIAYTVRDGIYNALVMFVEVGKELITSFAKGVVTDGPKLLETIGQLVGSLITSAILAVGEMIKAGAELVSNFIAGVKTGETDIWEIGVNIVKGVWEGIKSMTSWIVDNVKGFFGGIVKGVKETLGIHSPSKVFEEEIGKYIALGTAQGISKNATKAEKAAAEMAKKAYESAKLWISDYRNSTDYLVSEELKMWEILGSKYEGVSKEKVEIDKNIAKLRKDVLKEQEDNEKAAYENSKNWIENKKALGQLSLTEELAAWQRVQKQYAEGTKQRQEADQKAFEVEKKIAEEKKKLTEEIVDAEKKYTDAVEARSKAIYDSFGLFDELKKKDPVSADSLTDNLQDQVDELESWRDNLSSLMDKGVDEGLIEELQNMGPSANAEIAALAGMTDRELTEYQNLWQQKSAIAKEMAVNEFKGLRAEVDEEIKGLKEDLNILDGSGDETAEGGQATVKVEKTDPKQLKTAQTSAEEAISSVTVMIQDEMTTLTNYVIAEIPKVGKMAYDMVTEFAKKFLSTVRDIRASLHNSMYSAGRYAFNGFFLGIRSMEQEIISEARGLARKVKSTLEDELDINSPSRVLMEVGEFAGLGFSTGIENTIGLIEKASRKLGLAAVPEVENGKGAAAAGAGGIQIVLQIENYHQHTDTDLNELSEKLGFVVRQHTRGRGR